MIIFISGISTGVGKTFVSSILVNLLEADYWKPIETGIEEGTKGDPEAILELNSELANSKINILPRIYTFKDPVSPDLAAKNENSYIDIEKILIPSHYKTVNNNKDNKNNFKKNLIIEGAGGLLVPLNEQILIIDLIKKLQVPVILVSQTYLGSINHTLLSIEALKSRDINLLGIIFNGDRDHNTENSILNFSSASFLGYTNYVDTTNKIDYKDLSKNINVELIKEKYKVYTNSLN